jgi:tetratricopeptide (TPR) repeat protein
MKKLIALFLIIIAITNIFSEEMKFESIQNAYKKSYDYETMQKYEKAIKSLGDVYKNYPDSYTVNYRLGWLYYLNKNYKNALTHLNKALAIFPSSVEVLNTIDLVYAAQQDWTKLEQNAIKIINIDYYNTYANYWYSFALKKQGKFDLALKVDYKMLAILPSSISFLTEVAENLYLSGNIKMAEEQFKNVLILDTLNETAKYYLKLIEDKGKEKK